MKQRTSIYNQKQIRTQYSFPNAATQGYRLNKIVDYLLTAATTLGIVVAILFLFML